MTPAELAALHARCFIRPRAWTAKEFVDLLENPNIFLLTRAQGFLLGRAVADEAELLTLAVAPEARRNGAARDLVAEFAGRSRLRGATCAFLEVAADNAAAGALYRTAGWQKTGVRRHYYGPDLDAIVMGLRLKGGEQGG